MYRLMLCLACSRIKLFLFKYGCKLFDPVLNHEEGWKLVVPEDLRE